MLRVRRLTLVAGLCAGTLLLASCGASGNGGATSGTGGASSSTTAIPAASKDGALAAQVPADVAADGKIVIAADTTYAPNEFIAADGTTIVGMDVDLGTAIAQKLGLKAEFITSDFAGILPGLSSGRYELGMSSFTDNKEREQTVDMVSYFSAGTKMATPKGNPDKLSVDDLCGKSIAVQKGTVQVDDLTARSDKCKQAGKAEITLSQFQAQTDVTLALTAKRAVAMLADSPVIDYAVSITNGQLEAVGDSYDTAPYGIAVPKNKGDFSKAVQGAVKALMADGTYAAILQKWGVSNGAITSSDINKASAGG